MLRASVKIALGSLLAARTRTILTTIGITIGVASILLVFAAGAGARAKASDNVSGIPAGTALLAPAGGVVSGASAFDPGATRSAAIFSGHDISSLSDAKLITASAPIMEIGGAPSYDNKSDTDAFIAGTSGDLFGLLGLSFVDGNTFSADSGGGNNVVLGRDVAEKLFGTELASGKKLTIHGDDYTVAGVIDSSGIPSDITEVPVNDTAFISVDAATSYSHDATGFSRVFVAAQPADYSKITGQLASAHDGQTDFAISQPHVARNAGSPLLTVLESVTAVTAGLSLVIGGIGIMNIMLVNVSERTREIGIRKSIGASNGAILLQFLIEAVVMSLAGGLLGILLGLAAGVVGGLFLPFGLLFTPAAISSVVGVSLGIGIFFGLFPAIRAARKDTIEALRYYQ